MCENNHYSSMFTAVQRIQISRNAVFSESPNLDIFSFSTRDFSRAELQTQVRTLLERGEYLKEDIIFRHTFCPYCILTG